MKKISLGLILITACNISFAGTLNTTLLTAPTMAQKGFFVGLGGSYNSVYVQQDLYASGISNVYTSSNTLAAMGQASGDANPFNDTNSTLAPQIQ